MVSGFVHLESAALSWGWTVLLSSEVVVSDWSFLARTYFMDFIPDAYYLRGVFPVRCLCLVSF